jgi:GTP-binding protein HflX
VGYTNAGKSTLLNTLTQSRVFVEDQLFATLDPTSRRLRFPRDLEVIVTDTVGFIRDLPSDLLEAFAATLEELHDADLLLHVVDVSSRQCEEHIRSVEDVLEQLGLQRKPILIALNKMDRLSDEEVARAVRRFGGVPISALSTETLRPLISALEDRVERLVIEEAPEAAAEDSPEESGAAPEEVAAGESLVL